MTVQKISISRLPFVPTHLFHTIIEILIYQIIIINYIMKSSSSWLLVCFLSFVFYSPLLCYQYHSAPSYLFLLSHSIFWYKKNYFQLIFFLTVASYFYTFWLNSSHASQLGFFFEIDKFIFFFNNVKLFMS